MHSSLEDREEEADCIPSIVDCFLDGLQRQTVQNKNQSNKHDGAFPPHPLHIDEAELFHRRHSATSSYLITSAIRFGKPVSPLIKLSSSTNTIYLETAAVTFIEFLSIVSPKCPT